MRSVALLAAGSAGIHQLRYAIGYGDSASQALAAHPHGYLSAAFPGILTAALIGLGAILMRAAGTRRTSATRDRASLLALWLACSLALASVYGIQETLEGAGAIAGGGWIGLALAVPAGLLVALALRGADAAEAPVALAVALRFAVLGATALRAAPRARPSGTTASALGARGPPLASVV